MFAVILCKAPLKASRRHRIVTVAEAERTASLHPQSQEGAKKQKKKTISAALPGLRKTPLVLVHSKKKILRRPGPHPREISVGLVPQEISVGLVQTPTEIPSRPVTKNSLRGLLTTVIFGSSSSPKISVGLDQTYGDFSL